MNGNHVEMRASDRGKGRELRERRDVWSESTHGVRDGGVGRNLW
jgi:hypothetical protein